MLTARNQVLGVSLAAILAACSGDSTQVDGSEPFLPQVARFSAGLDPLVEYRQFVAVIQVPWELSWGRAYPRQWRAERRWSSRMYSGASVTVVLDADPGRRTVADERVMPCYRDENVGTSSHQRHETAYALRMARADGVAALCLPAAPGSTTWAATRLLIVDGYTLRCQVWFAARPLPIALEYLKICDSMNAKLCTADLLRDGDLTACGPWSMR